ncbi:GTP-binding protein [Salinicola salarius]|uniref:GTP-binding protein n=1 Tax=Salinicola salarius TaxID=430457 RepID=UPI000B3FD421|nr:GTP-binding protein [Salinicola salarius]
MSTSILPIPATLLCGFLGSGKTSRINTLIASGELANALFLVNDFGRINIDAELIESQEDHILRLTNGCACCGIAGNLSAQLRDIRRWPTPPSHLVFEASGIARPRPLMQLLDAARGYRREHAETWWTPAPSRVTSRIWRLTTSSWPKYAKYPNCASTVSIG